VSHDLAINKTAKSYYVHRIFLAALPQIFNFMQAGCIVSSHVKLTQYLHHKMLFFDNHMNNMIL